MLALTFVTGIIDAVGYLGLDRVFTANMTGNLVILGMGLAGADNLPIIGPALALGGFALGAVIGGRVVRTLPAGWSHRSSVAFSTAAVLTLGFGTAALIVPPQSNPAWAYVVTMILALAMGVQAAAARRLGVKDVTTVVITSTLMGLAADSRMSGGDGQHAGRRAAAVALMLVGAVMGALMLRLGGERGVGIGMMVAGALSLTIALIGHWLLADERAAPTAGAGSPS